MSYAWSNVLSFQRAIKLGVGVVLLAALLSFTGVRDLAEALSRLGFAAIAWLLFLSAVLIYVSALKWRIFIRALAGRAHRAPADVGIWRLFRLYLVGYFVNLLLPSYVGGDAVRSFYVGKSIGQHEAAAATVLERYTGLVAMVTLGCLSLVFSPAVTFPIAAAVLGVGVCLIVITVIAVSPHMLHMLSRATFLARTVPHLAKVQASLNAVRGNYRVLLVTFGLSFVYHLVTVVNTAVAGAAVGWTSPPFVELLVVLPLILLIGAIPISPSGLGIQEGAFVFFLVGLGASSAEALALGLVLRAKSYVLALLGWLCWTIERGAVVSGGSPPTILGEPSAIRENKSA